MPNTFVLAATLLAALAGGTPASEPSAPQASASNGQDGNAATVSAVADAIEQRYVFPEAGTKIAAFVRDRASTGAYAGLTGGALADALTRDLRVENGDRHLYVQYQPSAPGATATLPGTPAGPVRIIAGTAPGQQDLYRRRNYFLNRAERLDGNVGYLEVRRFFGASDDALQAAAAAMAFLSQTDAFIIDVRYAPGGDARMVDILASYFFDKVTPTLATYFRSRDETIQRSTLENLPGKRRPDIPVYVLTSRDTGSAAEDFAFLMQQTGRAKVVGDKTAGAGNTNAILGLGGGYSVSISIGRTFNPKTNQGWEGTGVQPDVPSAAIDALDTAHRLALTAVMEKTTDAAQRTELSWTRDALDARRTPVVLERSALQAIAGQYGVRTIAFADGRLWYQRADGAERIPLIPLSRTEFAMGEGQRLQFATSAAGMEMRMLNTDGTQVAFPRRQ